MDWVPMAFYGTTISVGTATTTYVILYPLPDYVGDQEFLIEDEDELGLFLERVVGDVHVSTTGTEQRIEWQLMPLGCEYETPAVLQPIATDWTFFNTEWANLRWWDRRVYNVDASNVAYPYKTEHPYWTHVDIHPRQQLGAKRNLWPCLVLHNPSATESMRVTHTLRALYK